jgi:hypothetical protein
VSDVQDQERIDAMSANDDTGSPEPEESEHSSEAQAADEKVNGPLTRTDTKALSAEWGSQPGED